MTDREFWARVHRRAAELRPDIAREYLRGFEQLRRTLPRSELERLIRTGALDPFLTEELSDQAIADAFRGLRLELRRALRDAILAAARDTPAPAIGFNLLDPRVLEALRLLDSRVMRTLSEDVREVFRATVADGIRAGRGPRTIANRALDTIGLAPNQARAVARFREQLESGDRAALRRMLQRGVMRRPDGSLLTNRYHAQGSGLTARQVATLEAKLGREPLTPWQIDTFTRSYEKRLTAWNTETNARTAALEATKRAQRMAWEDAIQRGLVDRAQMYRRWTAVGGKLGDGRNREEHLAMHGEEAHIDQSYKNGETVPGESTYNCRCVERWFVKRNLARAA